MELCKYIHFVAKQILYLLQKESIVYHADLQSYGRNCKMFKIANIDIIG